MTETFLDECILLLSRTPAVLNSLLRDLPRSWTDATEGPGTWSPHIIIGHLIHGERTDWMPRLNIILEHGPDRAFDPFDRDAIHENPGKPISALLDEFSAVRRESLDALRALKLQPEDLDRIGLHPELGKVTLRQLLATWTAHDLSHILQISRVLARRLKPEVGPWVAYATVLK